MMTTFVTSCSKEDVEEVLGIKKPIVLWCTTRNIFGQEISKESLKKVVPVTLKKGENKTVEIKLN